MSAAPVFLKAAEIEASLELAAERCEDLTPLVYAKVFERHPEMLPHFWRDTKDAIKGEMLSRTFSAILDFVGERRYADHMILTEMVTHEGYDVPREVFATFFGFVRDAVREVLGADWTPPFAQAWDELLAEIDGYIASASAPLLQPAS
ncbi:globin [Phenylobacterium sp.]|uniref:globin n=1 Tax=Phenylobacterium sp. TaxID=1871053 RepID=UPI002E2F283F|nr:globin [Phenylobacterium sp.]HEX2559805.1 globin [Phenylobacterium sp.]